MIPGTEGPTTAALAQESSDDTIELELTREQGLALLRAAEAAPPIRRAEESRPLLAVSTYENFASRRTARVDFVCNVTFAVAVLGVAAAFLWPASHRHPLAPAVARTAPPPAAVVRPVVAEPQGPPVRVTNAFDPKEVFEFPQGTTETDAREAVAELLLSRAHERLAPRLAPRLASNLQPDHGTAVQQPEVFVTRLARAKEPLNGTN